MTFAGLLLLFISAVAARAGSADLDLERIEGAKLISKRLNDLSNDAQFQIVTADFNAGPDTETYRVFRDIGFEDAFLIAGGSDDDPMAYTYHGFKGERPGHCGRIDWILLRGKETQPRALSCSILRDQAPPLYPSDHYPVIADIAF